MFFSKRYIQHLEQEITDLKSKMGQLEARNEKLTDALIPVLRRMEPHKTAGEIASETKTVVKHKIITGDTEAKCSCGWLVHRSDPADLQTEVTAHYRENAAVIRAARKSWPQIKEQLENAAT